MQWTIAELASEAATAVERLGIEAPNGKVAEVPDVRMLRYYASLGLLDRPADVRGRTAYYDRRHLLQVIAVKRLQAEGATLAAAQRRLTGRTDTELEGIARLDEVKRRKQFWAEEPELASAPPSPAPEPAPALSVGVPLAPGCTVLFTPARTLDGDDLAAIRDAGRELLATLERRGLVLAERNHV
ncbi:MerR family transcriptional regulator [Nocardia sp. NPDC050406]|uniref:helix-turn-helix domain-containing protein n=1 Tax=Nocardia sp. NPDC050406 TaxID=3364318 RepID=UPI00379AEB7F